VGNRRIGFTGIPLFPLVQEFAVLILMHPTSLAPKNQRSFHELVGSSECFPGQYRRGAAATRFFTLHAPDCLS
jgi:hypothetical protein